MYVCSKGLPRKQWPPTKTLLVSYSTLGPKIQKPAEQLIAQLKLKREEMQPIRLLNQNTKKNNSRILGALSLVLWITVGVRLKKLCPAVVTKPTTNSIIIDF